MIPSFDVFLYGKNIKVKFIFQGLIISGWNIICVKKIKRIGCAGDDTESSLT